MQYYQFLIVITRTNKKISLLRISFLKMILAESNLQADHKKKMSWVWLTSEVASRLTFKFRVVSSRKEYTWCSDALSDFLVFNIGRTKRDWLFHTTSSQVHHHNLCTLLYKWQSFCASHWMTNKNHRKWTEQCKLSLLWSLRKKKKKHLPFDAGHQAVQTTGHGFPGFSPVLT